LRRQNFVAGRSRESQEFRASAPPGEKPLHVDTHDFPGKELGEAIPDGVYDLQNNESLVSVRISHDTAQPGNATLAS
jgi:hypothetical protein